MHQSVKLVDSSFDAMGHLTSFKSSCGASSVARPLAFGNYIHTMWLPARPMTPISSPLTIRSARCASGEEYWNTEFHRNLDRRPNYRILLQYGTDEPIDAPLHPLRLLRQAMHQALYVHDRQRARSLSTIRTSSSYTQLYSVEVASNQWMRLRLPAF